MTILKWWISDSIDVCSSWRGGSTTLRSSAIHGSPSIASSRSMDWAMMRVDSRISSMCTLYRAYTSPSG